MKKVVSLKQNMAKSFPQDPEQEFFYGSAKVHKIVINNFPPFQHILWAIGMLFYNLAKFLVPFLSPLTEDNFTVKDSFSVSKEMVDLNPDCLLAILDVGSLFTNIPVEKTIDNIINDLFCITDKVHSLEKNKLKQPLTIPIFEGFFVFDNKNQSDGVIMGSPLGPRFHNACLHHYKKKGGSQIVSLIFNLKYLDDMLMIFFL